MVLQFYKYVKFSEIFFHDRRSTFLYRFYRSVYSNLKLEKMVSGVLEQVGCCIWGFVLLTTFPYWNLYPRKTNSNKVSNKVFRRIFEHRALPLRITHRTELYLSLVGKKCRFFVSVLGNISVYALVIFITLSVLMIFSNLTFLDTKQSGVQLVLEIQRVLGVQIRKSFVTIRDWSEKIQ